jgi:hypothetical protein
MVGGFTMRKNILAVLLVSLSVFVVPLAASPGLTIEARGGAGITMGTSDNPNATGSPELATGGGLVLDCYAFSFGPVSLGLSAGAEYALLNFHGVTTNYLSSLIVPGITQTSDSTYNYLIIPVSLVGHMQASPNVGVTLRAGGFAGYFLGGQAKLSYNTLGNTMGLENGTNTLNTSNTEQWEYGLHFSGGPDIKLGPQLTFSPSLEFNMGLTDSSVVTMYNPSKSTFWSLTGNIGIKYALF